MVSGATVALGLFVVSEQAKVNEPCEDIEVALLQQHSPELFDAFLAIDRVIPSKCPAERTFLELQKYMACLVGTAKHFHRLPESGKFMVKSIIWHATIRNLILELKTEIVPKQQTKAFRQATGTILEVAQHLQKKIGDGALLKPRDAHSSLSDF